ncbi:hypothetical protein [Motilibacter deserti]|uniref:Uncharacterized protein n=1 Tax=Motilibacter deserti TaxID=2714956 RepID=A0ABX0GZC3_9ACTN|nr:hypothetical protein [Motilibacter deserti]NHC15923.1 hypothetical protein [Motilibacter deserti]
MSAAHAMPRLLGPLQKAVRLGGAVRNGAPVLRDGVLEQRRGLRVRRVALRDAAVELVPGRPRRLSLRAGTVEVELLRVWPGGGRSRSPDELEALAAALGPAAAPVAEALRAQAAHLRGELGLPDFSPLAAYVGRSGTRLGDLGEGIGSLP